MCKDINCIHSYRINDVWSYLDIIIHFQRSNGKKSPIIPYKIDYIFLDEKTGEEISKKVLVVEEKGDVIIEEVDQTPFESQEIEIGTSIIKPIIEATNIS